MKQATASNAVTPMEFRKILVMDAGGKRGDNESSPCGCKHGFVNLMIANTDLLGGD
jgi:hypothetical protein